MIILYNNYGKDPPGSFFLFRIFVVKLKGEIPLIGNKTIKAQKLAVCGLLLGRGGVFNG
mgnify:CR=1 FL=1